MDKVYQLVFACGIGRTQTRQLMVETNLSALRRVRDDLHAAVDQVDLNNPDPMMMPLAKQLAYEAALGTCRIEIREATVGQYDSDVIIDSESWVRIFEEAVAFSKQ